MRRSVEHACLMPRSIEWDRKAAAHAEIFALLAEAADHPLLAQALNSGAGFVHHLMVTAGPATGTLTAGSRKRLLAFLLARNPEGAAHEMESYLRVLRFMGRLADLPGVAQGFGQLPVMAGPVTVSRNRKPGPTGFLSDRRA
jgi:DNA-binding FadR family transcriptional regulator